MAAYYTEAFLREAKKLLETLRRDNIAHIDSSTRLEMARALHSFKSGAAFLGWEELEQKAHSLEAVLAQTDNDTFDWKSSSEQLENWLNVREKEWKKDSSQAPQTGRMIIFSSLECQILEESQRREESFYRLTCRIDSSEVLPYPRAYLVSGNIEKNMTLIKTDPPMSDLEANFVQTSYWFTTESSEEEVFQTANIDLVEVLDLVRLDYGDILEKKMVLAKNDDPLHSAENDSLSVDYHRYREAVELAEELAWRLEKSPGTKESSLSIELENVLESLAFRPLGPLLNETRSAVLLLAERRHLRVRFETHVASAGLDKGTLETLGDVLKQLLRNSLRHGIEPPEERLAAGKPEEGCLSLSVERAAKNYHFVYADDGRGLDEKAIYERAEKMKLLTGEKKPDLLSLLCIPGFSMLEEADLDGGRGMGFAILRHMLHDEFDSHLELINKPGQGLQLRWTLPEKRMRRPYLVFHANGRSWAIPTSCVYRREIFDATRLGASGQLYQMEGGFIPMVGPLGLLPPGTVMPYVLEIRHRQRRVALLVEDLVTEEPWAAEDLIPSDPASPWCRSLSDAKEGIPILSPALVYVREGELPADA